MDAHQTEFAVGVEQEPWLERSVEESEASCALSKPTAGAVAEEERESRRNFPIDQGFDSDTTCEENERGRRGYV